MQISYPVQYGPPPQPPGAPQPLETQLFHIRHHRTILLVLICLAFLSMMLVIGSGMFYPQWISAFAIAFIIAIWAQCAEVHALEDSIQLPKAGWRK
jgi:hypothetical protein